MDKTEKKEFIGMVCEAIDKVVTPQFDDVHKEFKNLHKEMNDQFKNVSKQFITVNARLDIMQKDIDWIKEEIKNIYERLDEFPTRVEFEKIKKRVMFLENKLNAVSR